MQGTARDPLNGSLYSVLFHIMLKADIAYHTFETKVYIESSINMAGEALAQADRYTVYFKLATLVYRL
jgi:hypothetical protein